MKEGTAEGHVIIIDLQNVTLGHVARLGIMSIKHYLYYVQEALPFRLKGLHFINIVPFVDKIVFLMKPFMKKELWEVFHLHSTMETVHKMIDADVLPSDYPGGKALSYAEAHGKLLCWAIWVFTVLLSDSLYKELTAWREYFLQEEKTKRVNEKARPGKPKNVGELFGMEGNFRKLELD